MFCDASGAAAGAAATGLMPYAAGTGTSAARYAGVEQPTNTALSTVRDLCMSAALISGHQRWSPWMERLDAVESLDRRAGCWHRSLSAPVHVSAHQHVEERREEQPQERYAEHSREYGDSHPPPHLGAGAAGNDQRYDTGDERKGRHQNWTQPDASRLEGGGKSIASLKLEIACEFDDKNRVLAREPHQHEQPDLGEDVVVTASQPHAGDRGDQGHRHDQHDHERQGPTLVLRCENEEHQ